MPASNPILPLTSYISYLTSLLIDPGVLHGPLQPAAVLIQAGRLAEAHRLLLRISRTVQQDPNLWLLLAWTAPTRAAAYEYYQVCSRLDPSNELARVGLASTFRDASKPLVAAPVPPSSIELDDPPLNPDSTATLLAPSDQSPSSSYSALIRGLLHLSDLNFRWIMVAYLSLLALAELVTTFSIPQVGVGLHALLMIVIFFHASNARIKAQQRFLFTVALAPLIRILSLSMPLTGFQFYYWYAIIGLPLLLSAYLVFRLTGYRPSEVGLSARNWPVQLFIGAMGLPLGWLEYQILKPAPLVQAWNLSEVLVIALILLVFTGFLEEFIFRGLMQRAADNIMRKYGPYWISLLFAVLHIGYRSILDFTFVLFVGLIFAIIVKRTKSILGVTLAHGLTNICLYILVALLLH